MHKIAQKTESLNPPHDYVPWIVIDGMHTEKLVDEAFKDLKGLVCKLYSGVLPKECQANVNENSDQDHDHHYCFRDSPQ